MGLGAPASIDDDLAAWEAQAKESNGTEVAAALKASGDAAAAARNLADAQRVGRRRRRLGRRDDVGGGAQLPPAVTEPHILAALCAVEPEMPGCPKAPGMAKAPEGMMNLLQASGEASGGGWTGRA